MAQRTLSNPSMTIGTSLDNVVIVNMLECSPVGGRTLDVSSFTGDAILAGHVIIRDTQGAKEYKPMPINSDGSAYETLPSNHEIVGVCFSSVPKRDPSCTIMVRGSVNAVASPYPVTEEIKQALPLIIFTQD